MENFNKSWVVEWSESQQSYHIDTIEKMLNRNINAFANGRKTDYKPLIFAESQSEAVKLKKQLARKKTD